MPGVGLVVGGVVRRIPGLGLGLGLGNSSNVCCVCVCVYVRRTGSGRICPGQHLLLGPDKVSQPGARCRESSSNVAGASGLAFFLCLSQLARFKPVMVAAHCLQDRILQRLVLSYGRVSMARCVSEKSSAMWHFSHMC